jgi:diaminopropionate ammonia-lyase
LGESAVIYMPSASVPARVEAIRSEGAEVILVDGSYDDAVRRTQEDADRHGWQVISDTSYPGYTVIPRWIMAGYTTMFAEIDEALDESERQFDLAVLQAGVGALAAAGAWYYNTLWSERPRLITVEPVEAACMADSFQIGDGKIHPAGGVLKTIMAGLNCGTPSIVAWPLIDQGIDAALTISDDRAREAMRCYYNPEGADPRIISGESGAAGLGALLELCSDDMELDLTASGRAPGRALGTGSRVLLLNTEGDTDPGNFNAIIQLRCR